MRKMYITSPVNFSHNYPDTLYEYEFVIAEDISLDSSTLKLRSFQSIVDSDQPDNFVSTPFKSLRKYNTDTKSWVTIQPDTILHASEVHGTYRGILSNAALEKKITLYLRLVDSKDLNKVLYSTTISMVSTLTSLEILNRIPTDKVSSKINVRNFIEYSNGSTINDYEMIYKATNNLNDDEPTWDILDSNLINSTNFHVFSNRVCTSTPEIGVKTIITAKPSANGKVIKVKDIYIGHQ